MSIAFLLTILVVVLIAVAALWRWSSRRNGQGSAAVAALCGLAVALVFFGAAQFLRYYTGLGGRLRLLISIFAGCCVGLLVWRGLARRAKRQMTRQITDEKTEPAVPCPTAAAQTETVSSAPLQPETPLRPKALAEVCYAAAMGYLFIYFNINLGTLDVLPDWMGYLFILNELGALAGWEPAALLLRPLGFFLAGYNGVEWGCAIFGYDISAWPVLPLVVQVVNLYFHFQLLTNLADAVRRYLPDEADALLWLRTVNTLFLTFLALPLPWTEWEYAAVLLMILCLVVTFALWWRLRVIRSALLELEQ